MNEQEIKKYVEERIEYHCDEFGLKREEVLYTVLVNIVYEYEHEDISEEDLLKCADYLGFELDMEEIEKQISARKIAKQKREARKKKTHYVTKGGKVYRVRD